MYTFACKKIHKIFSFSVLSVYQLTKQYQESSPTGLQPVSFELVEGQTLGIVGESGSGKTTLLRLVGGLLEPDAGTILLDDQPVTGPAHNLVPGHPDIKMVFQDFALAPKLTVYDNVARILRAYSPDYRRIRTEELLHRFLLTGLARQYPATLSGGEKQRVALARAIAEEPRVLLMDEPFSQVDAPTKYHLLRETGALLAETASTTLFVTHDVRDALALSDRILVLRQGKVVQIGSPQQIYEQPATPYVARLGKCNILPVSVLRSLLPDFSSDGTVGIRPEHIHRTTEGKGLLATVVRNAYQGGYYEATVRLGEHTLLLYHPQPLEAGKEILIDVETERVMRFEDKISQ